MLLGRLRALAWPGAVSRVGMTPSGQVWGVLSHLAEQGRGLSFPLPPLPAFHVLSLRHGLESVPGSSADVVSALGAARSGAGALRPLGLPWPAGIATGGIGRRRCPRLPVSGHLVALRGVCPARRLPAGSPARG